MALSKITSKRYYFDGPKKEFPTQNAAQRHAEWAQKSMKQAYGERIVASTLVWTKDSVQVVTTLKA